MELPGLEFYGQMLLLHRYQEQFQQLILSV